MNTKGYYYLSENLAYGPYTAQEMKDMNLPGDTPVTDDVDNGEWKTAADYGFSSNNATDNNDSANDIVITLDGAEYLFFYMKDGEKHGPRSAKNMLKQNLPPDTPVTESSMNGKWVTAGDIDFEAFAEHEKSSGGSSSLSGAFFVGLIILVIGIGVTVISYTNAEGGGTYVVAIGAIITGISLMIKGA